MTEPDIALTTLDRSGAERFQRLRNTLGVQAFGMNLIVLHPGERSRVHIHERQEEVYLVLEGQLTVQFEDDAKVLGPDDVMRVGPAVRRQIVNAGDADVVLLALGGAGEHEGRDAKAWTTWDEDGPGRPPQEVPLPEA